jgi:hypothetical protein
MNTQTQFAHVAFRRLAAVAAPVLLAFTLALTGCATRKQVAEIVTQSNAAMLAGQFGLPAPSPESTNALWQAESDRIDAFIAAHPNQEALAAPLRIRQAMLLLSHGQFHLAAAAFNAVELEHLHTARDQALKRNDRTLLWWFATSAKPNWDDPDRDQARLSLRALAEEQERVADSPEIRDYLAEMRAWIGLAAARQSSSEAKELLEDALDVYAEVFSADDLVMLLTGREEVPDPKALGPDVRRRLRAKAVIAHAKQQNQADELGAHPKNPTFDQLLNRR